MYSTFQKNVSERRKNQTFLKGSLNHFRETYFTLFHRIDSYSKFLLSRLVEVNTIYKSYCASYKSQKCLGSVTNWRQRLNFLDCSQWDQTFTQDSCALLPLDEWVEQFPFLSYLRIVRLQRTRRSSRGRSCGGGAIGDTHPEGVQAPLLYSQLRPHAVSSPSILWNTLSFVSQLIKPSREKS